MRHLSDIELVMTLDGEMEPAELAVSRTHLSECKECAEKFERLQVVSGRVAQPLVGLARLVDSFRKSQEAQIAWSRVSARQGYRPIDTALGIARPIVRRGAPFSRSSSVPRCASM